MHFISFYLCPGILDKLSACVTDFLAILNFMHTETAAKLGTSALIYS